MITVIYRYYGISITETNRNRNIFRSPPVSFNLFYISVQIGCDNLCTLNIFQRNRLAAPPDSESISTFIQTDRTFKGRQLFSTPSLVR